jgi:acyl carrier protein
MSSGLLDSVSFLRLVGFMEDRFGVTVQGEELIPDNFETLDAMAQLLASKSGSPDGVAQSRQ